MSVRLRTAMLFAAGFGKRMGALTIERPKPLIEVAGRSMLARALDALEAHGVELVVVNTHYLAEQVHHALWRRRRAGRGPRVVLSHEPRILDTGGGIAQVRGLLGDAPFVSVNADVVLLDGAEPALERLARGFDPERMDALLLLQPRERALGYEGTGDFALGEGGALLRTGRSRPYVFTGVQVWHPRVFERVPHGAWSLSELYGQGAGGDVPALRLFGLAHDGAWLHVGDPRALAEAEQYLSVHEQDLPSQ